MSFPTPTSPLYPLALAYIRAGDAKDYTAQAALLADDGSFSMGNHPKSLFIDGQGRERVGKEVHLERARQMGGEVIDHLGIDTDHPVNVVEAKDCIVVQLDSSGKLTSGRDFNQEWVYIIRFNKEQKITSVDIWNDSAAAHAAFADAAYPTVGKDGLVDNLEEVTGKVQ